MVDQLDPSLVTADVISRAKQILALLNAARDSGNGAAMRRWTEEFNSLAEGAHLNPEDLLLYIAAQAVVSAR